MMRWLVGVLLVFAVLYFAAAPYLTAYRMKAAADDGDSAAVSRHVDFDAVRDSLRTQLQGRVGEEVEARTEDNPLAAAVGGALGRAAVDSSIDAYVTPEGVAALMRGEDPSPGGPVSGVMAERLEDVEVSAGYRGINSFAIVLTDPESGREADFILTRRGLGWKLTAIQLPLQ